MESLIRKLEIVRDCLEKLKEIANENPSFKHYSTSWRRKDISKRNLQKIVETFMHMGKIVISEKGLKEPSNNREVFMILSESKLFPIEYLSFHRKNGWFKQYPCP